MQLVPESESPMCWPEPTWLAQTLRRKQAVLEAVNASYRSHDTAIHVEDEMWLGFMNSPSHQGEAKQYARTHYMYGGRSAMRCIADALVMADAPLPRRIMDFPCGHGRVTRFLRAAFPDAEIYAGDINHGGVAFCAERFGTIPVHSQVDLEQVELPGGLDLIWCGSLITHLPEEGCLAVCRKLVDALAPGGIAGITVCSRGMAWAQRNMFHTIDPERFETIDRSLRDTGFGYEDYPWAKGYGMTFVDLRWIRKVVESRTDAYLLSYMEKSWHGAQDTMWIVKRPLDHWYHWGKDN
jgi:trans-aconitate methyltransferase